MNIEKFVTAIPDFPIPGVLFRDITPLLGDYEAFQSALDRMVEGIDLTLVDAFAGIESRGFILASALAVKHQKGFVPIRKKGKLPPPVERFSYTLEYGQDTIEMKPGKGRLVLIDDVLATGGTASAALELCAKAGYTVEDISFLINLPKLNQFRWKNQQPRSVLTY